jgi:hypothetical protein
MMAVMAMEGCRLDRDSILKECAARLSSQYEIVSACAGHDGAGGPLAAVAAVVKQDVFRRMQWTFGDRTVDVIAISEVKLLAELQRGSNHRLIRLWADGEHVFGSRDRAICLRDSAQKRLSGPAPAPTDQQRYFFEHQPIELLHKFDVIRHKDSVSAALILSSLVKVCVDAFFALNRIWPTDICGTMDILNSNDEGFANSVRAVFEETLAATCKDSRVLKHMVECLLGPSQADKSEISRTRQWTSHGRPAAAEASRVPEPQARALRRYEELRTESPAFARSA